MPIPLAAELMTLAPAWCVPQDPLETAARLMVAHDCGAVPVVDDLRLRQPIGIITDRNIVTRVVAKGLCAYDFVVRDVMTSEPVVLHLDASFHDCAQVMEAYHVRRIVVVDDRGKVVGIITDGDLARACRAEPELEHALATMVEKSGPTSPRLARSISPFAGKS